MATRNIKNLDDALYEKLRRRAEAQHRSIAQEVTHILAETLENGRTLSILELDGLGRELWAERDAVEHVAAERDSWD